MAHLSTGQSPYKAVYGYNPRHHVEVPAVEDFACLQEKILEEVQSALKDAKCRMKEQYDKHVKDTVPYEKGKLVNFSF